MFKVGEKYLCKKDSVSLDIYKNSYYILYDIHSLIDSDEIKYFIFKNKIADFVLKSDYSMCNKYYGGDFTHGEFSLSSDSFMEYSIYNYFYTKQEELKIKLHKLNNVCNR